MGDNWVNMAEQRDDIILDGLKSAVVEAFFHQQTYWDMPSQTTRTYGGSAVKLVEHILNLPKFQKLLAEIAQDVSGEKEKIEQLVLDALRKKSEEALEKAIKGNDYYLADAFKTIMRQSADTIAKEVVTDKSSVIRALVEDKVGKGDWNLQINVSVAVTDNKA
jgi:hypothetical protein